MSAGVRELREILAGWAEAERVGETCVLGSVVHAAGSTYRKPGARVLVLPDDGMIGLVSGGCLEGDLLERARGVRARGEALRVRYDATASDDIVWGLGLGCAGVVDMLLEPITSARPGPLPDLARFVAGREAGVLATVLGSEADGPPLATHWASGATGEADPERAPAFVRRAMARAHRDLRTRLVTHAGTRVLVEVIPAPIPLLVFGAGPDAGPLVRQAAQLGWDVTVLDGRPAYAKAEHFPEARAVLLASPDVAAEQVTITPGSVVLVMTHHYLHDRALLRFLLEAPLRYLGVLGPKQRTLDLLQDLRRDGFEPSDAALALLYAPAGLDLGSEGPEEIALAVVAEIRAVLAGRSGGALRDRKGPIHDLGP